MIRQIIIEIITDVLLIGMAGDLLYLYFTGGWREPTRVILFSELAILFFAVGFGCWRLARFIKKYSGREARKAKKRSGI